MAILVKKNSTDTEGEKKKIHNALTHQLLPSPFNRVCMCTKVHKMCQVRSGVTQKTCTTPNETLITATLRKGPYDG